MPSVQDELETATHSTRQLKDELATAREQLAASTAEAQQARHDEAKAQQKLAYSQIQVCDPFRPKSRTFFLHML